MEGQPFDDFCTAMFEFIDAHEIRRLVVDMRFNGGGRSEHIQPFFEELGLRPALDQGGLYVILGRQTYSSAVLNAVEFDHKTHATFVGESPSSVPNHYGDVSSFILPNSKLRIDYSTKHFPMTKIAAGEKLGMSGWLGVLGYASERFPFDDAGSAPFVPNVPAEPTIHDYVAGRDPMLEAILDLQS